MSFAMSQEDREKFLADVHVGTLGVSDPRGCWAPLIVPVWYSYEPAADLFVETGRESLKARFLREAGCFSLCVQVEVAPYRYVSVEGPVVRVDDPLDPADHELLAFRYLPPDTARAYLAANAAQLDTNIVFRMRPQRWRTADFSAFAQAFS